MFQMFFWVVLCHSCALVSSINYMRLLCRKVCIGFVYVTLCIRHVFFQVLRNNCQSSPTLCVDRQTFQQGYLILTKTTSFQRKSHSLKKLYNYKYKKNVHTQEHILEVLKKMTRFSQNAGCFGNIDMQEPLERAMVAWLWKKNR